MRIEGTEPDIEVVNDDGRRAVAKRYPGGLEWREKVVAVISLDAVGAFTDSREYYTHKVMDETKRVHVRLEFHHLKPPRNVEVRLGHSASRGERIKRPSLRKLSEGRVWEFEKKRPRRGEEYRIEWDW